MKRIWRHHLLLSLIVALWPVHKTTPVAESAGDALKAPCGIGNSSFQAGEEVVYKIYYHLAPLWLAAGEVHFRVDDLGSKYRFRATAFTYKSYEWFYRGHYAFESVVSKESLMPEAFYRTIEEKRYTRYNKFLFDHNAAKVTAWQGRSADVAERKVLDITECTHDMLSILYYVRNMDFNKIRVGQTFPIDIFLENHYPLTVKIITKNEEKRIKGMGRQMTHLFSPQVIAGEYFNEDAQMMIWVSADENKIPLLIESPVRIGKIKAVLHRYNGLRHKFDFNEG